MLVTVDNSIRIASSEEALFEERCRNWKEESAREERIVDERGSR